MEINKDRAKKLVKDKEKLREISEFVDIKADNAEMRETILAIKDTMEKENLTSLSAPQIGIYQRIFCVRDSKGLHSFVNPMLEKSKELTFSREKDECFPDKEYIYPRMGRIIVDYQTPMGEMKKTNVVGYSAFVFQRMLDHLNGIINSDIGLEIDELWDQASEEERAEVLEAYAKSLDVLKKKVDEDISKDENLTKQIQAIEFEKALVSGDVELETKEVTEEQKEQITAKLKESAELEKKEINKE